MANRSKKLTFEEEVLLREEFGIKPPKIRRSFWTARERLAVESLWDRGYSARNIADILDGSEKIVREIIHEKKYK